MQLSCPVLCFVVLLAIASAQGTTVGSLPNFQHGIEGTLKLKGTKTLIIEDFHYDGQGPDVFLYYYPPGVQRNRNGNGLIIPVSSNREQFDRGRRYAGEDVEFSLPDNVVACDIGTLTMWCRAFRVFFTAIEIPRNLFINDGTGECRLVGSDMGTEPPATTEPTVSPSTGPVLANCETLDDTAQVSWSLDKEKEEITFQLCSCEAMEIGRTDYIAFGVSGSSRFVLMFEADPVVAWVDDTGGHAVDYHLSGYFQCRGGRGACPDVLDNRGCSDDVTLLGGSRVNGRQCITFKRGYSSNDSVCDLAIDPDKDLYAVWGVGPLGETAFRHVRRADFNDPPLMFGRDPKNNCPKAITCREDCEPFEEKMIIALTDETFVAQIGPSALDRGYSGITGRPAWGIAWYINNTLIPKLVVERGRTYTFIVEGGDDPNNLANYHPLYITDSISGGWTLQSTEEQLAEKRFAGFDDNDNPTAAGRRCNLLETEDSNTLLQNCYNEENYTNSLELSCDEGKEAILEWTPDENTPDLVYYQCAVHLNLGWEICVIDAPPTETPSTPATSPTTQTPATSPTTERPTTSPTTETPATSPTTETPATSPTTETPATSPTTETPATSPTTETPAMSPTTSPTTQTPATSPTTETPATSPTTETPATSPTTSPTTERPATSPTTERPATSPTTQTPATSPTTETPATSPTTETPATSPTTQTPATSPTTETPNCPPRCTYDFCTAFETRKSLCSNPSPSASSNCTQCHLTYCRACYNSLETITSFPADCGMCSRQEVAEKRKCFRQWTTCIRRAHAREYQRLSGRMRSQDNFACYNPVCVQ